MKTDLQQQLSHCKGTPTLPAVAVRIMEICRQPEPELTAAARIIATDPGLSARLLRMANSPMLGAHHQVTTISHAIAMLGFNALRSLAISLSIGPSLKAGAQPWFRATWKRSALAAVSARSLAAKAGYPEVEEAFLAGLMQDIGMVALAGLDVPAYSAMLESSGSSHTDLIEAERRKFECDHAEVGEWLAGRWNLPSAFAAVIGATHRGGLGRDEAEPRIVDLSRIVAVSGTVADVWLQPDRAAATRLAVAAAAGVLDVPEACFHEILGDVRGAMDEVCTLLEVSLDDASVLDAMLEEAREALLLSAVSVDMRARENLAALAQQTRNAEARSRRDALTGISNRAGLEEFLSRELERSRTSTEPLSLLIVDIDRFKKVNDVHGHLAGDQVLRSVATKIRNSFRPHDMVARYGGEEFVVVLANTAHDSALAAAERCRSAIESMMDAGGDGTGIRVTASLGCVTTSCENPESLESLLGAVDEALYRAKNGGRNRVCSALDRVAGISPAR